jgi:NAD(P)-dependent dehydrogenase (short-subunit alcohol dehydrogenase family)
MIMMDHEVLSSVVLAAKNFIAKETVLHGLVNNAGILATLFKMTNDGYEAQFQTNHIAHWLFTHHLLPLLLETSKSAPAGAVRIVNLTSGGYMMAPKPGINFEDTSLINDNAISRYGQSKLANILHAKTLHRQYGPGSEKQKAGKGEIWTSSVHPGVVETELDGKATDAPFILKAASAIMQVVGGRWPADKGAWTSVFCVASPEMKRENSGAYYERIAKLGNERSKARDMELAEKLDVWTRREMESKGLL